MGLNVVVQFHKWQLANNNYPFRLNFLLLFFRNKQYFSLLTVWRDHPWRHHFMRKKTARAHIHNSRCQDFIGEKCLRSKAPLQ